MLSFKNLKAKLSSKTSKFFITGGVIYLVWFLLYDLYLKPKTLLDENIISNIVYLSSNILKIFSHNTYSSTEDLNVQMIGVDGAHPVWIGGPCDGVSVMAIFAIFIGCFPSNHLSKLWYIPLGLLLIHLVNVLRVCALAAISFYAPDYLDFNHTYTFTILVYGFIFLLWMYWIKKFAIKK